MFAYAVIALFLLTAILVGVSLTDSAMRARRAFGRLQSQHRAARWMDTGVSVTIVRPRLEPASTVVTLPPRDALAMRRALSPLAAAA